MTALAALTTTMGIVGVLGIERSNAALKTVYEDRTVALADITDTSSVLMRNRSHRRQALASVQNQAKGDVHVEVDSPERNRMQAFVLFNCLYSTRVMLAELTSSL